MQPPSATPEFIQRPTRHLFFTGKGGVGKTTLACAAALALAERGKSVLLVSTDPASNLDEMLRTAIEPYAWVINRSLVGTGTRDPVLAARGAGERVQIERVRDGLAKRVFLLPWQAEPPVGVEALATLAE